MWDQERAGGGAWLSHSYQWSDHSNRRQRNGAQAGHVWGWEGTHTPCELFLGVGDTGSKAPKESGLGGCWRPQDGRMGQAWGGDSWQVGALWLLRRWRAGFDQGLQG